MLNFSITKDEKLSFYYLTTCLRWATITVFLGRAWQHLYWDGPYRALLWDESWLSPIITLFGGNWETWATSSQVDAGLTVFVRIIGLFFLLAAFAACFLNEKGGWKKRIVLIAAGWLVFLALLYTKEKFFHLGQFFEYALQFGTPIFLWRLIKVKKISKYLFNSIRIAIALTFTCHGLYAIGYYPRPNNFIDMTMAGIGLSQAKAITFLNIAGVLDFVASFLVLLPLRKSAVKLIQVALTYMFIWGFLTAMARIWSYCFLVSAKTVLLQYVHESVFRFPHFLIPLGLLIFWSVRQNRKAFISNA